uniref:Ribosomal protein L29 n=1 Tax=Anotrichium furcellatum TaxID=41999 RepID=A0A4D6WLJ4_9FLOR|nr:ribosomal protein L29 [Anotrichium furcellatum]
MNNISKDIDEQIMILKKELIHYRMKKSARQEIKPHLIKNTKYKIANLLTKKASNLHTINQ